jgi:octaprenyl-diphosphate synthase
VTSDGAGVADLGLAGELAAFEAALATELESDVGFISAIGEDLVRAGGKRVRPTLALLAGRLLGADPERTRLVALAVEMLHSASLLHDDLIDGAATRRGEQAAFLRYGNVVSVMSGDFMLARVLRLLARSGSFELLRLMADAAAALCEGEVLQFQCATLKDWSYESYTRINEGKTAELMAAAVEGVALLAGAPESQRAALRTFGLAYGRAVTLGKPVGGDLREGKATYPVLKLMIDEGLEEARLIVSRHASGPGDVERMVELVREHGADAATRDLVAREVEAARAALDVFPPSAAKDELLALAERERRRLA